MPSAGRRRRVLEVAAASLDAENEDRQQLAAELDKRAAIAHPVCTRVTSMVQNPRFAVLLVNAADDARKTMLAQNAKRMPPRRLISATMLDETYAGMSPQRAVSWIDSCRGKALFDFRQLNGLRGLPDASLAALNALSLIMNGIIRITSEHGAATA